MVLGQAVRVAQPEVARAGQQFVVLPLSSSHLIDGIVDDLDGMKPVEGDGSVGQAVAGALDERRAHVDADLGDGIGIAAVRREVIGKRRDGRGVLALGREDDAGAINVDKERDIVVAAPGGGLVDRHSRDGREIGARSGAFDVMVNDAP